MNLKLLCYLLFLLVISTSLLWGEDAVRVVEVFPSTPFYRYIIYENLAIFWIAVLGLLILIRMKLSEIERVQKIGLNRKNKAAEGYCFIQKVESTMDRNSETYDKDAGDWLNTNK